MCLGRNPGLFVLGKSTHDRADLSPEAQRRPDPETIKAYIIPGGCGIILKIGVWHDFPVSCGPPVTTFVVNTEEVVAALASMKEPAPMDHGDCFKLRLTDHWNFTLRFPDPRPFVRMNGLVRDPVSHHTNGDEGYGMGMVRKEVACGWGGDTRVYVIPVIN